MSRARRTTTAARRAATVVVGVLVALPLALVTLLAAAVPAEASTYRYWTYWWGSGTGKTAAGWTFAQVGPAGHRVGDTWVLGWRFATTSTVGGTPPRQSADFATLCPGLSTPTSGSVRVALVVDYGTTSDAPPGQAPPTTSTVRRECLTVPAGTQRGRRPAGRVGAGAQRERPDLRARRLPDRRVRARGRGPGPQPATRTTSPTAPAAAPSSRPTAVARDASPASADAEPRDAATPATTSAAALVAPTTPTASTSTDDTDVHGRADPPRGRRGARRSRHPPAARPGWLVGAAVVAGIAGSAWWTSRRRGRTP